MFAQSAASRLPSRATGAGSTSAPSLGTLCGVGEWSWASFLHSCLLCFEHTQAADKLCNPCVAFPALAVLDNQKELTQPQDTEGTPVSLKWAHLLEVLKGSCFPMKWIGLTTPITYPWRGERGPDCLCCDSVTLAGELPSSSCCFPTSSLKCS